MTTTNATRSTSSHASARAFKNAFSPGMVSTTLASDNSIT